MLCKMDFSANWCFRAFVAGKSLNAIQECQ